MAAGEKGDAREGRREMVWLSIAGIVLGVAGISVPLLAGGASSTAPGQPSPWRENLSFALVMVGFVLIVAGLVRMVRAQMFTSARRERARNLTIGQRRQMGRWIRRGEAAAHGMAQATTLSAQAMVGQRKIALFYVGFALMMIGQAVGTTSPWRLVFLVFVVVVMVVGLAVVRRDADLAQRWLETSTEPAAGKSVAS